MRTWNLPVIEAERPDVLGTADGARAIAVRLRPGGELGEHRVRERAWLAVIDGSVQIEAPDGPVEGGQGLLATFAPGEKRTVRSRDGALLLLLLSPWPGEGHDLADAAERVPPI